VSRAIFSTGLIFPTFATLITLWTSSAKSGCVASICRGISVVVVLSASSTSSAHPPPKQKTYFRLFVFFAICSDFEAFFVKFGWIVETILSTIFFTTGETIGFSIFISSAISARFANRLSSKTHSPLGAFGFLTKPF
jgi:hypothetical protein